MKIRNGKYAQRKAISPIIATVLIIAVTLIAAVAIGGFVFGIFGSSSNSAQVSVTGQDLIAAQIKALSGTATTASCNITTSGGDTLILTNTGTAATTATGVTITYAGTVTSYPVAAGCSVGAAGATATNPLVLHLDTSLIPIATAVIGQTYTGTVTMGNGAVLIFTGAFN